MSLHRTRGPSAFLHRLFGRGRPDSTHHQSKITRRGAVLELGEVALHPKISHRCSRVERTTVQRQKLGKCKSRSVWWLLSTVVLRLLPVVRFAIKNEQPNCWHTIWLRQNWTSGAKLAHGSFPLTSRGRQPRRTRLAACDQGNVSGFPDSSCADVLEDGKSFLCWLCLLSHLVGMDARRCRFTSCGDSEPSSATHMDGQYLIRLPLELH